MNEKEEQQLRIMLEPIAEIVKETYIKAMLLRINVYERVARDNGAELEDIPEVIAQAIESANPAVQAWMDEIGQVKRAQTFTKGQST